MSTPCAQHAHARRLIQPALTDLTEKLRRQARKVTGPRQAILDVLRQHAHPLTNKEIHAALGTADCDLATVYRTMHALEALGMVRRVDFGEGAARFELAEEGVDPHHHHLVCRRCSMVVEIDDCFPSELERELARRHGFRDVSHRLEFFGVCPRCQAAGPAPSGAAPTPSPGAGRPG